MIIALVLIIDLIIGDPFGLIHPVVLIGNIINFYQKKLYKDSILRGILFAILVITTVQVLLIFILFTLKGIGLQLFTIYLIYSLIATKSLYVESKKVLNHLDDIDEARKYLSYIVGRDTSVLGKEQILKATIETVAENTIDGVLAPLFYLFLGVFVGHPLELMLLYKTVNTLDSMVGYKNEKYLNFGYFSAKIDDVLNYIPARVGSLLMVVSGSFVLMNPFKGMKSLFKYRLCHSSPNAGHPESVIAGLLDIKLGGPSTYFGEEVVKPFIGDGHEKITETKLKNTYKVMFMTVFLIVIVLIAIGGLYELPNAWG
jgi:adenosylcobinamide-phosphate synthase